MIRPDPGRDDAKRFMAGKMIANIHEGRKSVTHVETLVTTADHPIAGNSRRDGIEPHQLACGRLLLVAVPPASTECLVQRGRIAEAGRLGLHPRRYRGLIGEFGR